jgi:hypothetical protein
MLKRMGSVGERRSSSISPNPIGDVVVVEGGGTRVPEATEWFDAARRMGEATTRGAFDDEGTASTGCATAGRLREVAASTNFDVEAGVVALSVAEVRSLMVGTTLATTAFAATVFDPVGSSE